MWDWITIWHKSGKYQSDGLWSIKWTMVDDGLWFVNITK